MNRITLCKQYNKRLGGMTLIELLIVVVIIGVISSIVYPSYTTHVLKTHRAAAKADLIQIQLKLEETYIQGKTDGGYQSGYDFNLVKNNYCSTELNCQSDKNRFEFSLSHKSGGKGYTIKAEAKGVQKSNNCDTLTLSSDGSSGPNGCW